jgi:hypothetical protein
VGKSVTLKEAADSLQISVKTLRRALSRNELPSTTVDTPRKGTYILDLDAVHAWHARNGGGHRRPGPRPNPLDGVEDELKALRKEIERQTQVTASLEAELHETKAALFHAMGELQKALPAPTAPARRGFRWPWAKD